MSAIPETTRTSFELAQPAQRQRLEQMRGVVLQAARDAGIDRLEETLKWGEVAFVPPRRIGTTIRLSCRDDACVAFVHCQTTLVDQWRTLFPDAFIYEGTRAAVLPMVQTFDASAFYQLAAMALTYHRAKRV